MLAISSVHDAQETTADCFFLQEALRDERGELSIARLSFLVDGVRKGRVGLDTGSYIALATTELMVADLAKRGDYEPSWSEFRTVLAEVIA